MLFGRVRLMIRLLDLRWLRRSVLGSVLKERVRQGAADSFVKENEEGGRPNPFVGQAIRVGTADAFK